MNRLGRESTPFLFIINYELNEAFLCEHPDKCNSFRFALNNRPMLFPSVEAHAKRVYFQSFPIGEDQYTHKFNRIHQGLRRGDSFLANLTVKTPVETNLSLNEIFERSDAPYKIYLPGRFVCFSPERFVKISQGIISSNPMKGTISASIPNAAEKILADFKETAEHSTIVDLIRNDLSIVAKHVEVKRFRYFDSIITQSGEEILQVSSEITGRLPENYREHLGDIFLKLLPAGSISGAPKDATVKLIGEAEQEDRGFYSGIFGCFDGKNVDSAVMIRFIEELNGKLYFRSGGGITAYSQCKEEYKEVLKKIYLPIQ
ncbi:MAG: aminodeoxychorismate synthase component I [Mobilitalea sp.]